jgi:8-oxo-dGTP pyrophosphatase MutT (NUDIX family)
MIEIESALGGRLPLDIRLAYPSPQPGIQSSAVLVPLLKEEAVWKLLFTRRSESLAEHGGQISFPGGRAEEGDSGPLPTALREACEEIGISGEDIHPLGILEPEDTRTGFRIWPVVGIVHWPVELILSSPEVREVFLVPLDWLIQPGRSEWREVKSTHGGVPRRAPFFEPFEGRVIWGATASITIRLLEIIRSGWTA